jgi:hypothetical protein
MFEEKSGSKWTRLPNEVIVVCHDAGIMGYRINARDMSFTITKMVGDGRFWESKIIDILDGLAQFGDITLKMYTRRNPQAFIRKFGGECVDNYVEDGKILYEVNWKEEGPNGWRRRQQLRELRRPQPQEPAAT